MAISQSQLIDKFRQGKTQGQASHMYIGGDVIYSYGRHFPLLVRRQFGYLLNADKYSITTSSHQAGCRNIATEHSLVNFPKYTLVEKIREALKYLDTTSN